MTNQFSSNYNLFHIPSNFSNYTLCSFNDNQEKTWFLTYPKLINNSKSSIVISNDSTNNLSNKFISSNEKVSVAGYSNKFEKKNKVNLKVDDILDIKKKKSKLQKKSRKQINLDNEDVFINKKNNLILNEDNLNVPIIKVHKLNKNKKKSKNKESLNQDFKHSIQSDINHENDTKEICINSPLTVKELATKLMIPEAEIITYLFMKGISVTINQMIDVSIATDVALTYEFKVIEDIDFNQLSSVNLEDLQEPLSKNDINRPPIITILGHVDHGKTTLMDAILNTNLVKQEVGGITQSMTSYEVEWLYNSKKYKLFFLDTPGHEAFSSMRVRGTQVTDLVLLVVAADDGLKQQSIEAIKYILDQKLPYIVVINKIDKPGINTLKVREELAEYNIVDEAWGGDAIIIEVSALKRKNMDTLLSNICVLTDLYDFKANPNQLAIGTIIEAHLDQQKGPIANLVIQNGTLKIGDFIVAGNMYGKVKIILDNYKNKLSYAEPSRIVEVLGFSSVPQAGIIFKAVINQKEAKYLINNNFNNINITNNSRTLLNNRITLDSSQNSLNIKKLNLILKTDSQGSSEAIINAFSQISQKKVQINILTVSSGNISNTDIELAIASESIVLGFNVAISNQLRGLSKQLGVVVSNFDIIYDLVDYIESSMLDLVKPEYDKVLLGQAVVQNVFTINKGSVAGCLVKSGILRKQVQLNVYRDNHVIYSGILDSLKRMKDDVDEVSQNSECGVMSYSYNLWKKDDIIEAYELEEKPKIL